LSNAPEELSAVCDGALSLFGALRLVNEQVRDSQLSAFDGRTLRDHIARSNTLLSSLENALHGLRDQTEGVDGLSSLAPKLSLLATRVITFHEVIRRCVVFQQFDHIGKTVSLVISRAKFPWL
jgi:hypothetical protein